MPKWEYEIAPAVAEQYRRETEREEARRGKRFPFTEGDVRKITADELRLEAGCLIFVKDGQVYMAWAAGAWNYVMRLAD